MDHLNHCCLPFAKVLALGYYDGPIEGLLVCRSGAHGYLFKYLDGDDLRIFSLTPIDPIAIARLVEALSPYQNPRWPVWIPIWSFPTEDEQSTLDRLTDRVLAEAGPPGWVMATEDLMGEPLTLRKIEPRAVEEVDDWFDYLGLSAPSNLIEESINRSPGLE
jgi:hypothetical protein